MRCVDRDSRTQAFRRRCVSQRRPAFDLSWKQVQEEMRAVVLEDASVSSATLLAVTKEIEKDFPSRSHVMEVLEMLRLLCEGHNNRMQDLMHQQSSAFESADLGARLAIELGTVPSIRPFAANVPCSILGSIGVSVGGVRAPGEDRARD